MSPRLLIFALAMASYNGLAASMPIEVLDMRNSIQLSIGRWTFTNSNRTATNYSRFLTSFDSISSSITNERSGILAAEASSGMFTVHSHAPSSGGIDPAIFYNRGAATNELWFSPVSSQTATLSVFISAGGHFYDSSKWGYNLMNITTGAELGGYAFRDWGADPIIFGVPYNEFTSATVFLEADFHATDVYKLTLYATANTGDHPASPNVFLQISGLEAVSIVPEPSILSMLGFGLLVGLSRRR